MSERRALPAIAGGGRRLLLIRLLFNGVGQAVAAFALAWLTRQALADLTVPVGTAAASPLLLCAGFVSLAAVVMGLRVRERIDAEQLGQRYAGNVRLLLFQRLADAPSRGARRPRLGVTMTRLITDLNALKNWVSVGLARVTVAAVSISGSLLALAYLSATAALLTSAGLLLGIVGGLALTPLLRRRVRRARRRRGQLASNMGEKILAINSVVQLSNFNNERRRLRAQSRRLANAAAARAATSAVLRSLPDAALALVSAVLIGLAAFGRLPLDMLIAALLINGMMATALRDLAQAWDYRQSYLEARGRLQILFALPLLRKPRRPAARPNGAAVALRFERVSVKGVLRRASAHASAGERIVVTGACGSGKSTLLQLAAGLFAADNGRVHFDGLPIEKYAPADVRRIAQLVSPRLPLLRGSVADNIAYGSVANSGERVAIAELCGLTVSKVLPSGLNTQVDEGGRNLPTGLCSRIVLARALAARPKLLLIDDPLFIADPAAAELLQLVFDHYPVTALIVSPEGAAATIRAERIWRLHNGRLSDESDSVSPSLRLTATAS